MTQDQENELPKVDAIIEAIRAAVPDGRAFVPNEVRLGLVRLAYNAIKESLIESDTKFSIEFTVDKDMPTVGDIVVKAKEIKLSDMHRFSRVLEVSDNIDVYTDLHGWVHMTIGFYGLGTISEEG